MDVKDELNFYPLQVHSYYDFFESAMTPEEYAKGLMANGYSGGSLTDFLSFKGIAKYSNEFLVLFFTLSAILYFLKK